MEDTTTDSTESKSKRNKFTPPAPEPEPAKEIMNLHAFINVKKYSNGIEHRMQISTNNDASEKTLQEWEEIYNKTMNRITK